jgi:hypothetical protein
MDKIYILEEWNKGAGEWLARRGFFLTEDEALKSGRDGALVRVRTYEACEIKPGLIKHQLPKQPRYKFECRNGSPGYRGLKLVQVLDMLAKGERGCVTLEGCE